MTFFNVSGDRNNNVVCSLLGPCSCNLILSSVGLCGGCIDIYSRAFPHLCRGHHPHTHTCCLTKKCVIIFWGIVLGAIQVLRNAFFWKLDPHPPPRTANNIEPYTFATLFSRKSETLRYILLEWPLMNQTQ